MPQSSRACRRNFAVEIVEGAQDALVVLDEEFRIVFVNPAAERLAGAREPELLGRSCRDVFPDAANSPIATESFDEKLQRWFEIEATPLEEGCLAIRFRDITERKRGDEALERERAVLGAVTAATDVMLVYLDRDFNFVSVNPAYAETCKMRPEEMIGKNHFALYPNAENEEIFRRVRDTGDPVFYKDKPFEFPDQPERGVTYWDWSLTPVKDGAGGVIGLVFSLRETTKYKRASEALHAAEEHNRLLAGLLEQSEQPFGSSYADGRLGPVNAAFERLTGYNREELQHINWATTLTPEEWREPERAALEGLERTGTPVRYEKEYIRKDGTRVPIELLVHLMRDPSGEPLHYYSFVTDLTERKKAGEELRRLAQFPEENPNPVLRISDDGAVLYANAAASEWLAAMDPGDGPVPPAVGKLVAEVITRGKTVEAEFRDDRGFTLWFVANRPPDERYVNLYGRDVTERRQAEEALRRSEKIYRAIGESIRYGVWVCAPDGRNVYASESFLKLVGLTQEQCADFGWGNVLHPDDAERTMAAWQKYVRTEGLWDIEHRFRGVDGQWHPILARGVPVRDDQGQITCFAGINLDISALKQSEESLRESEQRFSVIFEKAAVAIALARLPEDRIAAVNENWVKVFGYAKEEAVGKTPLELNVYPDAEARARLKAEIEDRGSLRDVEMMLRTRAGEERVFMANLDVITLGGERYILSSYEDVTERKRAEEALATSERRLRALLESASQGVVAADEDGYIVLVNAKTEELFGYTRDELLGQKLEILLPERYRNAHDAHTEKYFKHPKVRPMGAGMGLYGRSKDGSEFSIEVSLSSIEQGGRRVAMALISDISERKKAEQRLWQAQKLESIGVLAGGVAHDFNNLLVGVIGNASLAREILPREHDAIDLMDRVIKIGDQLAHLTRQMLAYSGKGRVLVEPLDLSDLIPEMNVLVQPSIPKKIALQFDLEPNLPLVEADRGQIQQVFMNLMINAAEAIGSDAGMITVKTVRQSVDEDYMARNPEAGDLAPGSYVRLDVSDTGCGITEEVRAKIFDPFFSTKFTGRGLGLAAVAGIVRGHKGAIQLSSKRGQGSRFTVLLPAAEGAVELSKCAGGKEFPRGKGRTVLVVDDEKIVRELARRALERYEYKVLVAYDGTSAIDIFKRHPGDISLVLLDLSMPGMGGEEALPELRKIRPQVKFIVSSGYSEAETMSLFRGEAISGFVQKPYTSSQLAERVSAAITAG